ncbi:MAG: hypothetical protein JO370_16615 [Paucibacter sp.]|nr:hypothetical protein [Roseateles sp.]
MENENKSGVWGWLHQQLRTTVLNLSFWLGLTLGFPLEHFLWEHVWPFKLITKWLGL